MAFDGFSFGLVLWFAIFVVLYGATFGYQLPNNGVVELSNSFKIFSNINVMAFMGFGVLRSFNSRLGMTATALSLVLSTVTALWYILNRGLWEQAIGLIRPLRTVGVGQDLLVLAGLAVSSMRVGFGAVLGRVTPLQGLILVIVHVLFYSINESIGAQNLKTNVGGAITVHLFGAVFGATASLVLELGAARKQIPTEVFTTHGTILRSLLGSLFLFVYSPSFNCYFAALNDPVGLNPVVTTSCISNTYLAMLGGGLMAVVLSRLSHGTKTAIGDVQVSALASGIAVAGVSNLLVTPFGALVIGVFGTVFAVFGIQFLNPFLERTIGLRDTCTVLSLHGLPGFLGAIVSIIVTASAVVTDYPYPYEGWPAYATNASQSRVAALHTGYVVLTIGMSLVGGLVAGLGMRCAPSLARFGTDSEQWDVTDAQGESIVQ